VTESLAWRLRRLRSRITAAPQWRDLEDDTTYLDDNLEVRGNITASDGVVLGAHPNLATHDALGLSTDAELAAHAAAGDPHTVYATNAELDLHTGDTVDAHDASAVSILDLAGTFTATEVEAALAELTADDVSHAALPNIHHAEFTNPQHDALPNPHHSNANDHPAAHADTSHTDPPILKALITLLGDLIYGTGSATVTRLAGNITATRKFLRQTGNGSISAAPVWDTIADGDVPSVHSGSAHHAAVTLAADADAVLGLSGQDISLDNQTANTVFAGPTAGGAADPTFRALVDADIPAAIARDTEVSTAVSDHAALGDPHAGYVLESLLDAKGDLIAASADNTPAKVTVGADGTFLKADSSAGAGVSWATPTAGAAPLIEGNLDPGSVTVETEHFVIHRDHLKLSSTNRLTQEGTSRIYLRDVGENSFGVQGEVAPAGFIVLGTPKVPRLSFVVLNEYQHQLLNRLSLVDTMRASLIGTADLYIENDAPKGGRIALAGRG